MYSKRTESSQWRRSDKVVTWLNKGSERTFHFNAVIVELRAWISTFILNSTSFMASEDSSTDFVTWTLWASFLKTFFCRWAASAIPRKMSALNFSFFVTTSKGLADLNVNLKTFIAHSWRLPSLLMRLGKSSLFAGRSEAHNLDHRKRWSKYLAQPTLLRFTKLSLLFRFTKLWLLLRLT